MEKKYTKIILDKIKEYDSIIIMRHTRPDGDAIGSTMGLRQILRLSFPEKKIRLINSDYSDYVAFLENEDKDVSDNIYKKSLGIVVDTGDVKRISNKKYELCKELVKIDHHIDNSPYGDISWVEEERASACEMIAQFYFDNDKELKIDSFAATAIYTGMITDTGRFKYGVTNSSPFTYAGRLMDLGIDVELLYAHLYAQSFDEMKFKAFVLRNMKITENGVAYVYISRATQKKYRLNHEQEVETGQQDRQHDDGPDDSGKANAGIEHIHYLVVRMEHRQLISNGKEKRRPQRQQKGLREIQDRHRESLGETHVMAHVQIKIREKIHAHQHQAGQKRCHYARLENRSDGIAVKRPKPHLRVLHRSTRPVRNTTASGAQRKKAGWIAEEIALTCMK